MEQNKIRTYLLYAVGEIALVMIGILLALQVNNWNEVRKEKQLQQVYLNNLILDLENQLLEIDRHRSGELLVKESLDRVADMITKGLSKADLEQYNKDMQSLVITRTLNLFDATFEDLKSTGNLNLIYNPELKLMILNYFQLSNRDVYVIRNNAEGYHYTLIQPLIDKQLVNFDMTGMNKRLQSGSPMLESLKIQQFDQKTDATFNQYLKGLLSDINHQQVVKNVVTNRRWSVEVTILFLNDMEKRTKELIAGLKKEIN